MSFLYVWTGLPTWFLVAIIVVVAVFILKKLIKFALVLALVGVVIWLFWGKPWV